MPIYNPQHVEYTIVNGRITIMGDDGSAIPAYWSHPDIGGKFAAIAIVHDWWGITNTERHIADLFAQLGYYVIVPDLFNGQRATTPQEALDLVQQYGARSFGYIELALHALEQHIRCTGNTAIVGFGMGGTLAFEAAVTRADIEAAVAYSGFPNRLFGKFADAQMPILAFYGDHDPHITPQVIDRLRAELAQTALPHRVETLTNAGRDYMNEAQNPHERAIANYVWAQTLAFVQEQLGTSKR